MRARYLTFVALRTINAETNKGTDYEQYKDFASIIATPGYIPLANHKHPFHSPPYDGRGAFYRKHLSRRMALGSCL